MKKPIFLESTDSDALHTLSNAVTHFLCCFNYTATDIVDGYEPPYMTDIVLAHDYMSFTIVGCNQLSSGASERYIQSVTINQRIADTGTIKIRVNFPDTLYSYGSTKVYLSPCVVLFLNNNISNVDTNIVIRTASPLVTSLDSYENKLKITADTSVVTTVFAEPLQKTTGILSINGIKPSAGNIQVTGVGGTSVTVVAAKMEEGSSNDSM